MKPRYPECDREAALVALLKQCYAGELTEGQLLRALRRDVLGLSQSRLAQFDLDAIMTSEREWGC